MNNIFTKYLLENGWVKDGQVSYLFQKDKSIELFFDTSNQIELYKNDKRVCGVYVVDIQGLKIFLNDNNLTNTLV